MKGVASFSKLSVPYDDWREAVMVGLPEGFGVLEEFVGTWSLATRAERFQRRVTTGFDDVKRFYDATLPRMDDIVQHLNKFPIADRTSLPKAEETLFQLGLSFMEVALAVECFGASDNNVLDPAKTEIWL
jgi:hypothetical protein